MADQPIDQKQQHLDDHYGDLGLTLVPEPTGGGGKGMSASEATSFLRRLKPVTRVKQTLAQAAKLAKPKA